MQGSYNLFPSAKQIKVVNTEEAVNLLLAQRKAQRPIHWEIGHIDRNPDGELEYVMIQTY